MVIAFHIFYITGFPQKNASTSKFYTVFTECDEIEQQNKLWLTNKCKFFYFGCIIFIWPLLVVQLGVSEQTIHYICEMFLCSNMKFTTHASLELDIPQSTVHKALQKKL